MSNDPKMTRVETDADRTGRRLPASELLQLRRWNTPTIYNGWEQMTRHDRRTCFKQEETQDYMPQMGAMVGYAITVVCEPSNPDHPKREPAASASGMRIAGRSAGGPRWRCSACRSSRVS